MNNLLKSEFFSLLAKNSLEVSNDEMKKAYENFIAKIEILNKSDTDCQVTFRILSFTHIEFRILQSENLCEREKNAFKIQYCQKVIWYLESEIELLKLSTQQTNYSLKTPQPYKSKVYFIPKSKEGLGIDSMGEFATALELSHQFVNEHG